FLAWESLKGSVRFNGALDALKSLSDAYGSHNVAVAGDGETSGNGGGAVEKENIRPSSTAKGHVAAKLFVLSKGKQKFMEAHGLEQWWSDDLELDLALQN
nr:GDSL esterase/lipase At4g10955-like [Tanacetum cinerariifolium]